MADTAPIYTLYYTPALALGSHKVTYTREQIEKTLVAALGLLKAGHQVGEPAFPQAFAKAPLDSAHANAKAPFFSFPIIHDAIYNGEGPSGADRVVFGSVGTDFTSAAFVAVAHAHSHLLSHGEDHKMHVFADTSVNLARAEGHEAEILEAAAKEAPRALVPVTKTNEDGDEVESVGELLTEDDVKIAFSG